MANNDNKFCTAINEYIDYWGKMSDRTEQEKLRGLAFSILRLLDGLAPNFEGNLKTLEEVQTKILLHHAFRKSQGNQNE